MKEIATIFNRSDFPSMNLSGAPGNLFSGNFWSNRLGHGAKPQSYQITPCNIALEIAQFTYKFSLLTYWYTKDYYYQPLCLNCGDCCLFTAEVSGSKPATPILYHPDVNKIDIWKFRYRTLEDFHLK
jgi:hypothetical protein